MSPGQDITVTRPLRVGVPYLADSEGLAALGGNGKQNYGNERDNYVAYFATLNKSGGLGGRQVVGSYFPISSNDTSSTDELQQEMCSFFRDDEKVDFVVSTLSSAIGDVLRTCLGKAMIGLVNNSLSGADSGTFARFPTYVEPTGLAVDRIARSMPGALNALGYFKGATKVGVITIDRVTYTRATSHQLVPALRELGFDPVVVATRDPEQDFAGTSSDAASAVLKFRGAGVDHLLFLTPNGTVALYFTQAAESQGYRPRYAFTSSDAIEALVEGGLPNARQQLANAVGLGWQPWLDVRDQDNPIRPRGKACLEILAKAGINYTASAARWHALLGCDTVNLLQRAAQAEPGAELTALSLVGALARLGQGHESVATFAADFSARRDAAAAVRSFRFGDACTCFTYSGADIRIP